MILVIFLLSLTSCESNSSPDSGIVKSPATATFYSTSEKTFIFDSLNFKNIVGYVEPGFLLQICSAKTRYLRTCTSGSLPPYFIKVTSKLQKVSNQKIPKLTKVFAQNDFIEFVFEQSDFPPAVFADNQAGNLKLLLFPLLNHVEYIRYEKSWKFGQIILSPQGKTSSYVELNTIPKCGLDIIKIGNGILRLKYKNCYDVYKVALDPGHGGTEKGTCHNKVCESDLALKLALKIQEKLTALKITSFLTRTIDQNVTLQDRISISSDKKASLFISLHFDQWKPASYIKEPPRGSACYFFHNFLSQPARTICDENAIIGLTINNITQRSFYVLHSYNFPSVLFETGNFANPTDAERMLEPGFIVDAAEFIASKINEIKNIAQPK